MVFDKIKIFRVLSLLLISIGLICGIRFSIEAKKCVDSNMFIISPVVNDNRSFFSLMDREQLLNDSFEPITCSYEITKKAQISHNYQEATVKWIMTNSEYFTINQLQFTNGGAWPTEMNQERIAIVSEALAWKLFGNIDCMGEKIRLTSYEYTIAGVIKQDSFTPSDYYICTPKTSDLDQKENMISMLLIRAEHYNSLSSYLSIASGITGLNKLEKNYYITDMNRYIQSFELRYRLLVLIFGTWLICAIINRMGYILRSISDYCTNWLLIIAILAINIVSLAVIFYVIRFDFWVSRLANNGVLQTFFNIRQLPSDNYLSGELLSLSRINLCANIAFCAGMIGVINSVFLSKNEVH